MQCIDSTMLCIRLAVCIDTLFVLTSHSRVRECGNVMQLCSVTRICFFTEAANADDMNTDGISSGPTKYRIGCLYTYNPRLFLQQHYLVLIHS